MPAGHYYLTVLGTAEHEGYNRDLDLTDDVTILGAGADLTIIDGSAISQVVIHVLPGAEAILSNVGVTGGTVKGNGGGIFNEGVLTVADSAVFDNIGGDGGGIMNWDASDLTVLRSTISDNVADFGGGISSAQGDGTVAVSDSIISGNLAEFGGGIETSGVAVIVNSTISGNRATEEGGAIEQYGGGSTLTIVNSTIADNEAYVGGGGYVIFSGSGLIKNSIVANNVVGGNCSGDLVSGGYNIASDGSCDFAEPTDQENTDPLIGPLADNGGPTLTHALLPGSPAIDKVPTADCTDPDGNPLTADQRGVPRSLGAACDVGAYEGAKVEIDVKPGSDPNAINCDREKGLISVAILTTPDFDATDVDHSTVTFEGASEKHVKRSGAPKRHEEDVDRDLDTDLLLHFRLGDTGLTCESAEGRLLGETFDGLAVDGVDSVWMVFDD